VAGEVAGHPDARRAPQVIERELDHPPVSAARASARASSAGATRSITTMIGVMLIANASIYLFGASWLANWTPPGATDALGWEAAYELGIQPFVPGDIVKLFAAACLLPGGWRLLSWLERSRAPR
jgi:biotin transporter BioY